MLSNYKVLSQGRRCQEAGYQIISISISKARTFLRTKKIGALNKTGVGLITQVEGEIFNVELFFGEELLPENSFLGQ